MHRMMVTVLGKVSLEQHQKLAGTSAETWRDISQKIWEQTFIPVGNQFPTTQILRVLVPIK